MTELDTDTRYSTIGEAVDQAQLSEYTVRSTIWGYSAIGNGVHYTMTTVVVITSGTPSAPGTKRYEYKWVRI